MQEDDLGLFEEPYLFDDSYLFESSDSQEMPYRTYTDNVVPCFLKSTHILTEYGEKNIEDLKKGDIVRCYDGRLIDIIDIYSFNTTHKENLPYKIPKYTNINNRTCNCDLYLSPLHAVLVDSMFIQIQQLPFKQVNHSDTMTYYHIVLPNFFTDAIIANGIVCEGYAGNMFDKIENRRIAMEVYKKTQRKLLTPNEFNRIKPIPRKSEKLRLSKIRMVLNTV